MVDGLVAGCRTGHRRSGARSRIDCVLIAGLNLLRHAAGDRRGQRRHRRLCLFRTDADPRRHRRHRIGTTHPHDHVEKLL